MRSETYVALLSLYGVAWVGYALWRRQKRPEISVPSVLGRATDSLAGLIPISQRGERELERDLVRSGVYHATAARNYLAVRNVAFIAWVLFVVTLVLFELIPTNSKWFWLTGVGIAILVISLPRTLLSLRSSHRAHRIHCDLPDALDLMAMMLSGGMTVQQSLQQVIREFQHTHAALATELLIVSRQAESGTLDDALSAFARRLDVSDVSAFTAMLRGNHRAGGSLVESLRAFADELRRTRDDQARERGNKASIKLLLPVVFCLAPPIYVLLLGPAFLDLKSFVERENRPGGALAPSLEAEPPISNLMR